MSFPSALLAELLKKANLTDTQPVSDVQLANGSQKAQLIDVSGNAATMLTPSAPTSAWNTKGVRVLIGPTDIISNLPVLIDYDHHQLHEGETFRWSVYTASLASAANKDIRLVVPAIVIPSGINAIERCPHFRFEVCASDLANVYFYESTTFTGNGTQRTPVALERNGTYTPKLEIHEDPTVNAVGTLIWQGLLLGTKNSVGYVDRPANEFVLKNNTSYNFRVTSGASGNKVLIRYVWYEDLGV